MSGRTLVILVAGLLLYPIVLTTLHFIIFCDFARKVQDALLQLDEPEDPK